MATAGGKETSLGWAIGLSSVLCLMKGAAAVFCSSQALLASALDSFMDAGVSSVNLLSVRKASKPPDEDHAYGHEKIESLASYSQGILILIFAILLFGESLRQAFAGKFISRSEAALATIGVSILINFVITTLLQKADRARPSLILKAEKIHYLMDFFSYLAIFIALFLAEKTGWAGWDAIGGLLVAAYVVFLAGRIAVQAGNELVDHSLPRSSLDELDRLIRSHDPGVLDYHELRTRKAGERTFVDFHLVLAPKQSFEEAHEITESLIGKIRSRFPPADVTVHEDPEGGI